MIWRVSPIDAIPIVDFHCHLGGRIDANPNHREAYEFGPLDHVVGLALNLVGPLFNPTLDFISTRLRGRGPRWFYRKLSKFGWKQVAAIFERQAVENLVGAMDRNGISHAAVCAIEPFFLSESIATAIAPYPGRFSLFCSIDPYHPEPARRLGEIMSVCEVHGLKIHPALTGLNPSEQRMFKLLELAGENRLPVQIHTGTFPFDAGAWDDTSLLEPAIQAFPDVQVVLCHIGWDQYRQVIALGEKYANVHVETSWQPGEVIRDAVDALGTHRVLFGSDFPLIRQEYALAHIREALDGDAFRHVVSSNAMRLLRLAAVEDIPVARPA